MWNHQGYSNLHDIREQGLITVTSDYEYYDAFMLIKEKFKINIPDTAIIKMGKYAP